MERKIKNRMPKGEVTTYHPMGWFLWTRQEGRSIQEVGFKQVEKDKGDKGQKRLTC